MTITVTVTPPSVVPAVTSGATVVVTPTGGASAGIVGSALRISVANIDDPSTELAAVADAALPAGTIRIATQDIAGANAYRMYVLDTASSTAQSTPNRIDRTAGGQWVLAGGKGVAGTFTVESTFTVGDGSGIAEAIYNGAAGNERRFRFQTSGTDRWKFLCDSIAEAGSDAGSDFKLNARTDAGASIDNPIVVTRATGGALTFARPVTVSTASSGLTLSKTTGTTLVVSSTTAASGGGTGCATFAGGITVNGSIFSDAGRIVAGSSAVQVCLNGTTTVNPFLQCNNTSASAAAISNTRWSANAQGAATIYAKSRGATVGTRGVVSNNDTLGQLVANGDDGTVFREAGQINFQMDGATISSTSMPGRIVFLTTPSGTVTPVEALRLDSAQLATFAGGLSLADATNIAVATTTGTKIGTATSQKIGFWNVTPVIQPASASQAALTDSTGGTPSTTFAAITAGAAYAQADMTAVKNALSQIVTSFNAVRTALVNTGIMKGAA